MHEGAESRESENHPARPDGSAAPGKLGPAEAPQHEPNEDARREVVNQDHDRDEEGQAENFDGLQG
jgi:hypothetical protein